MDLHQAQGCTKVLCLCSPPPPGWTFIRHRVAPRSCVCVAPPPPRMDLHQAQGCTKVSTAGHPKERETSSECSQVVQEFVGGSLQTYCQPAQNTLVSLTRSISKVHPAGTHYYMCTQFLSKRVPVLVFEACSCPFIGATTALHLTWNIC